MRETTFRGFSFVRAARQAAGQWNRTEITRQERSAQALYCLTGIAMREQWLGATLPAFVELWDSSGTVHPRRPRESFMQTRMNALSNEELARFEALTREFADRVEAATAAS
jgi:hypothetical protein